MTDSNKSKAKMGRPSIFDSEEKIEQLKELMRLGPDLNDTAAFFQCGSSTIRDTIREHFDMTFRQFREEHMVHTRMMLVRTALKKAQQGDNTMLTLCLRNVNKWDKTVPEDEEAVELKKLNIEEAKKILLEDSFIMGDPEEHGQYKELEYGPEDREEEDP